MFMVVIAAIWFAWQFQSLSCQIIIDTSFIRGNIQCGLKRMIPIECSICKHHQKFYDWEGPRYFSLDSLLCSGSRLQFQDSNQQIFTYKWLLRASFVLYHLKGKLYDPLVIHLSWKITDTCFWCQEGCSGLHVQKQPQEQ